MQKQGLVRIKRKKSVLGRLYNKKCEVAKKWGRPLPEVKIKRKIGLEKINYYSSICC